jgi:hypothetical protein
VIDEITAKLAGLNLAKVSADATGLVTELTKSLEGIKDQATAQAALPELENLSQRIDALSKVQHAMSPGGQSMLATIVSAARVRIEELVSAALKVLGTDAAGIKPVLDDILAKTGKLATQPG